MKQTFILIILIFYYMVNVNVFKLTGQISIACTNGEVGNSLMVSAIGDVPFSVSMLTLHVLFLCLPYTSLLCLTGPPVPLIISLFHWQTLTFFFPPFASASLLVITQKDKSSLYVGYSEVQLRGKRRKPFPRDQQSDYFTCQKLIAG